MGKEIEAKFAITAKEASDLFASLKSVGVFVQEKTETNTFFDTTKSTLSKSGKLLRIRTQTNKKTGEIKHIITFKGKKKKASIKTRDEHEVEVSCNINAKNVLSALGFKKCFEFEKRRKSFYMDNCIVEIDELPIIGFYCEVEGPSQKEIKKTVTQLGFRGKKFITKGYGQLLQSKLKPKQSKVIF